MELSKESAKSNFIFSELLPDYIELRSFTAGKVRVRVLDIIRIEANKSYAVFHLKNNKPFISSHNLTYQTKKLNSKYFFRASKSCIINFFQIDQISNALPVKAIMADQSEILISRIRTTHYIVMYKLFLYEVNKLVNAGRFS